MEQVFRSFWVSKLKLGRMRDKLKIWAGCGMRDAEQGMKTSCREQQYTTHLNQEIQEKFEIEGQDAGGKTGNRSYLVT